MSFVVLAVATMVIVFVLVIFALFVHMAKNWLDDKKEGSFSQGQAEPASRIESGR